MRNFVKNEFPSLLILLVPFIYLYYVWSELPDKVAMHYNLKGEIDRFGNKEELLLIIFLLPVLTYLTFLVIPQIDSQKKIQLMGQKFHNLKFFMVLIMVLLSIFIIYTSHQNTNLNFQFLQILFAFTFITAGNFTRNIKQNHFIGVRTPWTLKNEQVWKEVHSFAGIMLVIAGFAMIIISLIFPFKISMIAILVIASIVIILPVVQSYSLYKKYSHDSYH